MTSTNLITKSELITRGWTEGLIKKYLGEPDALKTNPHYKSGPPMRLFATSRVEPLESEPWFLEAKTKRAGRSATAKKIADDKRTRLMTWVEELDIQIPRMDLGRLYERACGHYNELHWSRGNYEQKASLNDSPEFLNRIARNYIRHALTDYEERLAQLFGKVGTDQAYNRLKTRINNAISRVYPI